jgi:putative ABC transport system permease protein
MSGWTNDYTLSSEDKKFNGKGIFIDGGAPEMLSLKMLKGSYKSLKNPRSVILSKSTAKSIFGSDDPMNRTLTIDSRMEVEVTGIYDDIPRNNRFSEVQFSSPWALWLSYNEWAQRKEADWDNRPFNIYVQLQPEIIMEDANAAIKQLVLLFQLVAISFFALAINNECLHDMFIYRAEFSGRNWFILLFELTKPKAILGKILLTM